jgi:hypothetical protein
MWADVREAVAGAGLDVAAQEFRFLAKPGASRSSSAKSYPLCEGGILKLRV